MEIFYFLLGAYMLYATIHMFIMFFKKSFKTLNGYEKFVSIFAVVSIALTFIGIMFE